MRNLILSTLFLLSCAHKLNGSQDSSSQPLIVDQATCGSEVGQQPCQLVLMDQNGNDFDLYAQFPSPIVVDVSASWCGWCMVAAEKAQSTQDKYGITYVTVLVQDIQGQTPDISDLQSWSSTYGITTAPVVAGDISMVSSTGDWYVTGFPTFFFIDETMTVKYVLPGWSESRVEQYIQDIL